MTISRIERNLKLFSLQNLNVDFGPLYFHFAIVLFSKFNTTYPGHCLSHLRPKNNFSHGRTRLQNTYWVKQKRMRQSISLFLIFFPAVCHPVDPDVYSYIIRGWYAERERRASAVRDSCDRKTRLCAYPLKFNDNVAPGKAADTAKHRYISV